MGSPVKHQFTIHSVNCEIQILLLLLLYIQNVHLRRPVQRTTQAPTFPPELRDADLAAWKIPNKIFCDEMEKSLDSRLLVQPWWHHYCQDLKDREAKSQPPLSYYHLPIHRTVLDQLQAYRRKAHDLGNIELTSWTRKV